MVVCVKLWRSDLLFFLCFLSSDRMSPYYFLFAYMYALIPFDTFLLPLPVRVCLYYTPSPEYIVVSQLAAAPCVFVCAYLFIHYLYISHNPSSPPSSFSCLLLHLTALHPMLCCAAQFIGDNPLNAIVMVNPPHPVHTFVIFWRLYGISHRPFQTIHTRTTHGEGHTATPCQVA